MASNMKQLLVIGGRGALGQALVEHFRKQNVWVASVDHGENEKADFSINVAHIPLITDQAKWIETKLKEALNIGINDCQRVLNGIICVAGGWAGGNIASDEFLSSVTLMWKQSVESSSVAAYLAGTLLKENGLLVLTGAQAVLLGPTPEMIGYGMAKAAVHHLVKTLACDGSGLPKGCVVVGLLPRTLDTPNNRKFASDSTDYGSWTPLGHVIGLLEEWINSGTKNGSLVEIITKNGKTTTLIH